MSTSPDSEQVNHLINEKRYEEAKAILRQHHDPKSIKWLARLEELFPAPTPTTSVPSRPSYYGNSGQSRDYSTTYPTVRERGGCLTAWLVLASVANPAVGLFYLANFARMSRVLPGGIVVALVVAAIINTIFVVGIWQWQKWGVQGLLTLGVIAFFFNLATIGLTPATLGGLFGLGLVWFLVKDKWDQFE